MRIKKDSSTGYALEVNLEYPQKLHDIHNDYPLAPEKANIPKEWLSKYCLTLQLLIILLQEQLKI